MCYFALKQQEIVDNDLEAMLQISPGVSQQLGKSILHTVTFAMKYYYIVKALTNTYRMSVYEFRIAKLSEMIKEICDSEGIMQIGRLMFRDLPKNPDVY